MVPVEVEAELVPYVLEFLPLARKMLSEGHKLAIGNGAQIGTDARRDRPRGTFQLRGNVWMIALRSEQTLLGDRKGLRYIHTLLTSPHDAMAALLLSGGAEAFKRMRTSAQSVLDRAAVHDLRSYTNEGHDDSDAVRTRLRASTGPAGRLREFTGAAERARSAVRKAITLAIKEIEKECPALGMHLRASIHTGGRCVYEPSSPIRWEL